MIPNWYCGIFGCFVINATAAYLQYTLYARLYISHVTRTVPVKALLAQLLERHGVTEFNVRQPALAQHLIWYLQVQK